MHIPTNGVVPGMHFDKFNINVLKPMGIENAEVTQVEHGMTVSIDYNTDPAIRRIVDITEINYGGTFKVELKEIVIPIDFVTRHETFEINVHTDQSLASYQSYDSSMGYFYNRTRIFLKDRLDTSRIPPAEMLNKRDEINSQWLTAQQDCKVVLYSYNNRGDDWRFKIVHKSGTTIADYLGPDITGHTCVMFVSTAEQAFQRGLMEGRISTAETIAAEAFNRAFQGSQSHICQAYAPEAYNLLKTGSLRKEREVI